MIRHFGRLVRDRTRCQLGVFLGHRRVGVTEERLHLEQAHAALDQTGREGVTEGVTGGATVAVDQIRRVLSAARSIAQRITLLDRPRGAS